jgi:hypothetical protein
MTVETAPSFVREKEHFSGWRRYALSALLPLAYAGAVLMLFGGVALDHLPQSPEAQLGIVALGAALLLLAALWLDRREAKREADETPDGETALGPAE